MRLKTNTIEDAGTRVSGLVGKLLSFAREDSGRPSPVPVRALIEDAVTLIHGVLRRDGISVDVDVAPDLPEVPCCRSQIQQVLMNLLTNARDALNQRSLERTTDPTVEIAARLVTTDGRPCLRITVADCGDGMSPEVAERIFDPFFTTKGPDKGTGLGLSVSHGIVTEHGGALHVDSAPGEGARFHIDLPLAPE